MMKTFTVLKIAFIMLFSLAGCVAPIDELGEYKTEAKAEIQAYAEGKDKENYSVENWKTIEEAVTAGKEAVQLSTDKAGVDTAVAAAKEDIDKVMILKSDIIQNGVYVITDVGWEIYVRDFAKNFHESETWIQEVLNGDGGYLENLIRPRSLHWVAIFDDLLTVSREECEVYQFSLEGDMYAGYKLHYSIKFWLVDNVLFMRYGDDILQYQKDDSYQISEEAPASFSAPKDIQYHCGGSGLDYVFIDWNRTPAAEYFGAAIEVKKADSESFVFHAIEYEIMNMFVGQFRESDFVQGVNDVRIHYIGGPFVDQNTRQVYMIQDSEYMSFHVIVDDEGNPAIIEIKQ